MKKLLLFIFVFFLTQTLVINVYGQGKNSGKTTTKDTTKAKPGKSPKNAVAAQVITDPVKPYQIDSLITLDESNSSPIVENYENGNVNWTSQFVEAKGWTVMDTGRFKIPGQAELMARTGAIAVAQRNLLEIVEGVRIVSETTVKDMVTQNDYIYKRLDGMIKGAEMVGEPVVKGNIVEVTMRVPLYESKTDKPSVAEVMKGPAQKVVADNPGNQKIENVGKAVAKSDSSADNTKPSLFPVVYDDKGNLILDYTKYYDPKKGNFPKYFKLGKDAAKTLNIKGSDKVLNAVNTDGKLVLKPNQGGKIDKWMKVGTKVIKYGKFLMALLI